MSTKPTAQPAPTRVLSVSADCVLRQSRELVLRSEGFQVVSPESIDNIDQLLQTALVAAVPERVTNHIFANARSSGRSGPAHGSKIRLATREE